MVSRRNPAGYRGGCAGSVVACAGSDPVTGCFGLRGRARLFVWLVRYASNFPAPSITRCRAATRDREGGGQGQYCRQSCRGAAGRVALAVSAGGLPRVGFGAGRDAGELSVGPIAVHTRRSGPSEGLMGETRHPEIVDTFFASATRRE
jgi:hypothetical protein